MVKTKLLGTARNFIKSIKFEMFYYQYMKELLGKVYIFARELDFYSQLSYTESKEII